MHSAHVVSLQLVAVVFSLLNIFLLREISVLAGDLSRFEICGDSICC